jgi:hypothetical protein
MSETKLGSSATNFSARRINRLAKLLASKTYVEIGVSAGTTFHAVDIATKTAVDPTFGFAVKDFENRNTCFLETTSDDFFSSLSSSQTYDQYFIDGLHTFEQTLRDLSNALMHSHRRTVWLIDDTKPNDVFSSLRDYRDTFRFRDMIGSDDRSWHGDVFKVVFYIHDFCPGLNYRTIVGSGNIQTLAWRSKHDKRDVLFNDLEKISRLDYFAMQDHLDVLRECSEDEAIELCIAEVSEDRLAGKSCL